MLEASLTAYVNIDYLSANLYILDTRMRDNGYM